MNSKNLQTYANRVVEGMESLVTMNGYNDCIIGVVTTFNGDQVVAYDMDRVIARLEERDGMSYIDACEYFNYNMLGAWVGDHTPIFISMLEEQHKEPADGPPFEIEYGEDDEEGLRLVP